MKGEEQCSEKSSAGLTLPCPAKVLGRDDRRCLLQYHGGVSGGIPFNPF
jgi:hypothetical protein